MRDTDLLRKLARDESGQDIVEYVLLVAGISLLVFGGANTFGNGMEQVYQDVLTEVRALF